MTLMLAIDTATPRVAVAIGEDGRVLGSVYLSARRRHAEALVPAIAYLCEQTGVELRQLGAVAVGVGPGLFTGLRVGVTTAKIMGQALEVPVVGVSSLDLVAHPLRFGGQMIAAVLDARRHEVFHARYRPVSGGVQLVTEYRVGPAVELVAELEAGGEDVVLAGDGVASNRAAFGALERAVDAGREFEAPSATALVEIADGRVGREEFSAPWDVAPLYLRASDAELAWGNRR
jgi:tRNA threonylcarbamoyladenosine biosynthesis protein TsaB